MFSVWLMETVNLGLKIEYAKRELLAAGKDGMVKIHSEDQSFPQGGGGIKH